MGIQHPTPWQSASRRLGEGCSAIIYDAHGNDIACIDCRELATIEQIVDAVNICPYDDLVAALEAAREEFRLIHMKDTVVVYNPVLRTQIDIILARVADR